MFNVVCACCVLRAAPSTRLADRQHHMIYIAPCQGRAFPSILSRGPPLSAFSPFSSSAPNMPMRTGKIAARLKSGTSAGLVTWRSPFFAWRPNTVSRSRGSLRQDAIQTSEVDVVIIGAGIIGVAPPSHLALSS